MCTVKLMEAMICLEFYHGLVHFAAILKLLINKVLTFRTHHYRLTNHNSIEAEHKEFSLFIITPYIIVIILVGFMRLSTISSLYLGGYMY